MLYKEYRNEIPYNTLKVWSESLLKEAKWERIGWTGNPKEPHRHWASYPPLEGLLAQIWMFINETIQEDGIFVKPERVILNLYDHGDSSWLHTDSSEESDWTIILFLNEYWNINWGGDFVLVENNEIIKSFAATPGKFVAFKANIMHGARPVSREATYPRFGVAFQCKNDNNLSALSSIKVSTLPSTL